MKKPFTTGCFVLAAAIVLLSGCKQKEQQADIPDIQLLYGHISYLDSLTRSEQADSIANISDHVAGILTAYQNRAQSPEDVAILDSLASINVPALEYLRYCNSTQDNLDLLEQDLKNLESQYRSGKIKITAYISALLEVEQIIVDLGNSLTDKNRQALLYLRNQSQLSDRLSPLTDPGN